MINDNEEAIRIYHNCRAESANHDAAVELVAVYFAATKEEYERIFTSGKILLSAQQGGQE